VKTLPARSVVIVGGGLTGGLVARQLTARGIDTVVLERGGDCDNGLETRLPTQRDELRWAVRAGLAQDAAAETYTWRHSRRVPSMPLRRLEAFLPGIGVGGAGNHWNGQAWRWAEYDTALRSRLEERYGRGAIPPAMQVQDWGVSYAELEPYYDLFERLFGVSGQAGNLRGRIVPGGNPFEAPRHSDYPQPPLEATEADLLFRGAAGGKLGLRPFSVPTANSSGVYLNPDGIQLGACQYCGHCDRFVCEARAKGAPNVLLYPALQARPGFELRRHCHVLSIEPPAGADRVRGVRYLDLLAGREYFQPADVVVLSAFTLTNARLLLLSGIGRPYDPETRTGVVGRNFCYQINSSVKIFLKDRWLNPFFSAGGGQAAIDDFNDDNFDHAGLGFFGGGFIASGIKGRPIVHRHLPAGTPRWGSAWKRANADWYAHAMTIGVSGSCYPDRENFLDLDPDYADLHGRPLLRITFDIPENELRMSAYCTARAGEIAGAIGGAAVGPVQGARTPFDTRAYQTSHLVGGTAMGPDPATSVVSPRLQHWDAENLFVVGPSVFPHNSGHNPTGPAAALALRLGDDLARYLARPDRLAWTTP